MKQTFFDGFLKISAVVYLILAVNVLMMVACLPLIVILLLTDDLSQSWLALALVAPLTAPAVYAAFACFREHSGGGLAVARTYVRAWRRGLRRALPLGLAGAGLGVVIGVDIAAVAGTAWAAMMVPTLVVGGLVALVWWIVTLAGLEEFGRMRRRDVAKASLYCAVRGGIWSLITLAAVGLWGLIFIGKPALALSLATAPIGYVVWANSRYALRALRQHLAGPPEAGLSIRTAVFGRSTDSGHPADSSRSTDSGHRSGPVRPYRLPQGATR